MPGFDNRIKVQVTHGDIYNIGKTIVFARNVNPSFQSFWGWHFVDVNSALKAFEFDRLKLTTYLQDDGKALHTCVDISNNREFTAIDAQDLGRYIQHMADQGHSKALVAMEKFAGLRAAFSRP